MSETKTKKNNKKAKKTVNEEEKTDKQETKQTIKTPRKTKKQNEQEQEQQQEKPQTQKQNVFPADVFNTDFFRKMENPKNMKKTGLVESTSEVSADGKTIVNNKVYNIPSIQFQGVEYILKFER